MPLDIPPTFEQTTIKNQELPHLKVTDFFIDGLYTDDGKFDNRPVVQVPVDQVVGSATLNSWSDIGTFADSPEHLASLQRSLEYQASNPSSNQYPVHLHEIGGLYYVVDGQKRIMAAKALEKDTYPARVVSIIPTGMRLNETNYNLLSQRKERGLWEGVLNISLKEDGSFDSASAEVYSYEGVWVFAKDMDKTKAVYQQLGASGQAEIPF